MKESTNYILCTEKTTKMFRRVNGPSPDNPVANLGEIYYLRHATRRFRFALNSLPNNKLSENVPSYRIFPAKWTI